MKDYLIVRSRDLQIAVELDYIVEATLFIPLHRVPYKGPGYSGMITYRNETIPVYDLSFIFLNKPADISPTAKILIINKEKTIGLLVDDIESQLESERAKDDGTGYLKYFIRNGKNELLPVLDLGKIFTQIENDKSTRAPLISEVDLSDLSISSHTGIQQYAKDVAGNIATDSYLIFNVKDEKLAIDSKSIKEITDVNGLTAVPGSPEIIVGVLSVRGEITTIIDLSAVYFKEKSEISQNSRIIVCDFSNERIGILADSIHDFVSISEIDKFSSTFINPEALSLSHHQFEHNGELVSIISIERIIEELITNDQGGQYEAV